jgi:hypothetical protein
MALCNLCNDLQKKHEDRPRLAFDFTTEELVQSARRSCTPCTVILQGLQCSVEPQTFEHEVRRVYAICRAMHNGRPGTLSIRVYFDNDHPAVELEYFSLGATGKSYTMCCFDPSGILRTNVAVVSLLRLYSMESDNAAAINIRPPTCSTRAGLGLLETRHMPEAASSLSPLSKAPITHANTFLVTFSEQRHIGQNY